MRKLGVALVLQPARNAILPFPCAWPAEAATWVATNALVAVAAVRANAKTALLLGLTLAS
jgi:hypothetical protein